MAAITLDRARICDLINTLMDLDEDNFDADVHHPMAQELVDIYGRPGYFSRLVNALGFRSEPLPEVQEPGEYTVEHLDIFDDIRQFGFGRRVKFNFWKGVGLIPYHSLLIKYTGSGDNFRVLGIGKSFTNPKCIEAFPNFIRTDNPERLWYAEI